jgi:hypothetical protein
MIGFAGVGSVLMLYFWNAKPGVGKIQTAQDATENERLVLGF